MCAAGRFAAAHDRRTFRRNVFQFTNALATSVRLAGRIFGDFQKRMAVLNETTLLPTFLTADQ